MSEKFSTAHIASWIKDFRVRLRIVRESMNLSQADVAKVAGTKGNEALSRLERGDGKQISLELLGSIVTLSEHAGLSLIWLMTGKGPMRIADAKLAELQKLEAVINALTERAAQEPSVKEMIEAALTKRRGGK